MDTLIEQEQVPLVTELRCNYLKDPIGVVTKNPRLSWQMRSQRRGLQQSAYQVIVATNLSALQGEENLFWDSGKVQSNQSLHVPYAGPPLARRARYYWQVRVWDQEGKISPWSKPAYWEMALAPEEWQAKWITQKRIPVGIGSNGDADPAPMLRRSLHLPKPVIKAQAFICGLGYYELYINGSKVGGQVLAPTPSQFDRTVLYQTHDLTDAFQTGENVIGVILGNGWYNCMTEEVWNFRKASWRDHAKVLMQVHITFADGKEQLLVTDQNWRTNSGPIVFNSLRNGETYDARLEREGWHLPGYDDRDWAPAVITRAPGGVLRSEQMQPIRVTKTIRPMDVKEVRPGVWVYDLGQNISGWAKISVRGEAGTEVVLRYAELTTSEGDIDPSNIDKFVKSGAFQTDRYVLKGADVETWEPRFTYHGFRYVQVTGSPKLPMIEELVGQVVHTDLVARGHFSCSNPTLNRIQEIGKWSTLTNYHGFPTDCPHREKNGWTGDAQLSAEQVLFNFDPMPAYTNWLRDICEAQRPSGQLPGIVPTTGWGFNWGSGPAWDSIIVLVPWYLYLYCGDTAILADCYPAIQRYLAFVASMSSEGIVDFGLGDWCPPKDKDHCPCPVAITDTAYYYVDLLCASRIARILGKNDEANGYGQLAEEVRQAFRRQFFNAEGSALVFNSQTSLGCALYQGLVEGAEIGAFLSALVQEVEKKDRHIDCGILGSKYVMHALTENGRADLAYAMAIQKTYPGWGHWVERGATTMWEKWDGDASQNHHMFSDIIAWFYRGLAGIIPDPEQPGFQHVIVRPNLVDGLDWVQAWHDSLYGRISASWSRDGNQFALKLQVPGNCRATVYLPAKDTGSIREGNQSLAVAGISIHATTDAEVILKVGAGQYYFVWPNS